MTRRQLLERSAVLGAAIATAPVKLAVARAAAPASGVHLAFRADAAREVSTGLSR